MIPQNLKVEYHQFQEGMYLCYSPELQWVLKRWKRLKW
jgi:hypothetical protein